MDCRSVALSLNYGKRGGGKYESCPVVEHTSILLSGDVKRGNSEVFGVLSLYLRVKSLPSPSVCINVTNHTKSDYSYEFMYACAKP